MRAVNRQPWFPRERRADRVIMPTPQNDSNNKNGAKKDASENKLEQILVDTFIIDFEPIITDTQIKILNKEDGEKAFKNQKKLKEEVLSYYDEGDLANLLKDINEFYGDDILK